jgi:hypothetical protein
MDPLPMSAAILTLAAHSPKKMWTKPWSNDLLPLDIQKVLSVIACMSMDEMDASEITITGKTYHLVNATIIYVVLAALQPNKHGSLMDHGTNGGLAGLDTLLS